MAVYGQLIDLMGGQDIPTALAAATTLNLPDNAGFVELTGTASVTSLLCSPSTGNRIVGFIQIDAGATTFTNTDNPTTIGQMDLGGSNVVLGNTDVLMLRRSTDGTWVRLFNTNN